MPVSYNDAGANANVKLWIFFLDILDSLKNRNGFSTDPGNRVSHRRLDESFTTD